mmetsp:Transcript_34096/g.47256  ORF Transcript_34096/g.47256 Transcript_34096/m.47256 type:complete len:269 (-) Transcript_34096:593-1399(-)
MHHNCNGVKWTSLDSYFYMFYLINQSPLCDGCLILRTMVPINSLLHCLSSSHCTSWMPMDCSSSVSHVLHPHSLVDGLNQTRLHTTAQSWHGSMFVESFHILFQILSLRVGVSSPHTCMNKISTGKSSQITNHIPSNMERMTLVGQDFVSALLEVQENWKVQLPDCLVNTQSSPKVYVHSVPTKSMNTFYTLQHIWGVGVDAYSIHNFPIQRVQILHDLRYSFLNGTNSWISHDLIFFDEIHATFRQLLNHFYQNIASNSNFWLNDCT